MQAVNRNYLKVGDKVKLRNGTTVTVKALEFRSFIAEEKMGYILKSDILEILKEEGDE